MSIVFDEKGNVVGMKANADTQSSKSKVIICPVCGGVTVVDTVAVTSKTKSRTCPKCGTYLGEW